MNAPNDCRITLATAYGLESLLQSGQTAGAPRIDGVTWTAEIEGVRQAIGKHAPLAAKGTVPVHSIGVPGPVIRSLTCSHGGDHRRLRSRKISGVVT